MESKVIEWAAKMGYQGKLPNTMKSAINPSTAPIWAQIIEWVKTLDEVEYKKNIVMIYQLKTEQGHPSEVIINCPMKEIEIYKKKQLLLKKILNKQAEAKEKEKYLEKLQKSNKELYIKSDILDQNIKEAEQKAYLYTRKSNLLTQEIANGEEKYNHCNNLTPCEDEQNPNDVLQDLHKCAEKLETFITRKENNFHSMSNVSNILAVGAQKERSFDFLKDDELRKHVDCIFSKCNRKLIWKTFTDKEEELNHIFRNMIRNYSTKTEREIRDCKKENILAELHFIHIAHEFEAAKYKFQAKYLDKQIQTKENDLINSISDTFKNKLELFKSFLMLKKKEIGLTKFLNSLSDSLNVLTSETSVSGENDLQYAQDKLVQIQNSITEDLQNLQYKKKLFDFAEEKILSRRHDTCLNVRKLNRFTDNFTWILPLTGDLISGEIQKFAEFSLKFNRRFTTSKIDKFYRDHSSDYILYEENMDENQIAKLVALLENPSRYPEAVLLDNLQNKLRLAALSSIPTLSFDQFKPKFASENIEKRSLRLYQSMDTLIHTSRSSLISHNSKTKLKEVLRIWTEMPFKEFVSPERLFDSKNYKHYEESYEYFYNQL